MLRSLHGDNRGGAVVEMAIGTLIFVPLAFYGIWFSDTLHFGIRAQEASMAPAWDVTAKLLHNEATGLGSEDQNVAAAATTAQGAILADMGTSFDSADPGDTPIKQSVYARASALAVTCAPGNGNGAAPNANVDWAGANADPDRSFLPINTWLNCTSKLTQVTSGIPGQYAENFADGIPLFPGVGLTMSMCGMGPGITGCQNGAAQGFWLFTDDWGCENGNANALSIGSSGGNDAYFNVAQKFYQPGGDPGSITMAIAGWGDLAPNTPAFRMTYQRGPDGTYDDPYTEGGHGQSNPHGGASDTHTGGPWHDEGAPINGGKLTFATRANRVYMAVPGWPAD
jgi:hypothetical protein